MTIGLILTVLFVVLQVIDVIDWAWWQIAMPLFIEIGASIVFFSLFLAGAFAVNRR